jgi:hypothetical protein
VPKNLVEGKRYELDFCNACMLVAEVKGEIFIDKPVSCGCPEVGLDSLIRVLHKNLTRLKLF